LDLLLDAFSEIPTCHLYICGLKSEDRNFLNFGPLSNVHDYGGEIDIQSNDFLDIVGKCTYIILPSCSEACATAVATGMMHGLIPIVMKNSGFERLNDNALYLEDYDVEYIIGKIKEYSNFEDDLLTAKSERIYSWSRENFTIERYRYSLKNIINSILG